MNNGHTHHRILEKVWEFVRGDMIPADFEKWVYAERELENYLGVVRYYETIAADYSDQEQVYRLKLLLARYAQKTTPQHCTCLQVRNIDVIDMGSSEAGGFFDTLEESKRRGEPYRWLSLYQCQECHQWWLVASEQRHNDLYCLRRLLTDEAHEILQADRWPTYFDKFETLLRLGLETGRRILWKNPLEPSLAWMIADLAREKPGIYITEIAELLSLDLQLVRQLARKVVHEQGVVVNFGSE